MGKDLAEASPAARERIEQADRALGFSISEVMFEGPLEELTRTSRCQPALYVHGLVCLEMLKARLPGLTPVAAAGLSLGEFTAHAAAGTFSFETGLDLVARRGALMEEATDRTEGAMAAMIGGTDEAVKDLALACDVDVANYNAPGQIVLSGSRGGIQQAIEMSKDKGIRMAKELTVAGAYHSRLMQTAQDRLAPELSAANMSFPAIPVICNFQAREVHSLDDIRATLAAQVTGSVRWTESMQLLIERGHTTFIELGPGGILAGLMKRIDRSATVHQAHDVESIEATVAALS